jgi:hypothetical protein
MTDKNCGASEHLPAGAAATPGYPIKPSANSWLSEDRALVAATDGGPKTGARFALLLPHRFFDSFRGGSHSELFRTELAGPASDAEDVVVFHCS